MSQVNNTMSWIVFSDVDGTLLNHQDYDYEEAKPALQLLRHYNIPLILCSSKTAAELSWLRAEIGFEHCEAIVENGADILQAHADKIQSAGRHAELIGTLDSLPEQLRQYFSGFSSWSIETLQHHTGLSKDAASRASKRNFSEPGIWSGDDASLQAFIAELAHRGIITQQGGRFLTLSFGGNKVDGLSKIMGRYRQAGKAVHSIALGDASNDIRMLEAADIGIVIPNPSHTGMPKLADKPDSCIRYGELPAPAGWSQSLLALFDEPDFRHYKGNK